MSGYCANAIQTSTEKNARAQLFLLDGNARRGYIPGMTETLTPDEIVEMAKRNGMTPQQLCERAGVAYTVLWRWRTERGDIKLASYRALIEASNVPAKVARGEAT